MLNKIQVKTRSTFVVLLLSLLNSNRICNLGKFVNTAGAMDYSSSSSSSSSSRKIFPLLLLPLLPPFLPPFLLLNTR